MTATAFLKPRAATFMLVALLLATPAAVSAQGQSRAAR